VGPFVAFLVLLFAWANLLSSGAQVAFVYDPASNLVREIDQKQGASNRYDQVGAVAPTYDQRGNTTFDGNFCYVYDEQNRLSEVYILSGDSAARSTSTTSLAAEAPSGSTREQTRRGRFAVPDVVVLQRARQRLLARATGGPEEILRRHAEPTFVRQLREPLGNGAARRVVAGGSESLQSRSSGTGEGGVEEDVELQLLAVYLYDVFDRRVARVVVGVQTWVVAWDGWQEAEELVPTWQNGLVMAPQRQFVWGEQLDELVGYRYRSPATNTWASYFVAEGGAHCPQRVLDGGGQVVEIQEYDPYGGTSFFDGAGVPVGAASQVGNPFGWKAVRIDPETGLLYMRHRYYAPQWGRFLTQDPLGVWGDALNLGNSYGYGACSPIVLEDRSGQFTWFTGFVGALVGGAVGGAVAYFTGGDVGGAMASGAATGFAIASGAALVTVVFAGAASSPVGTIAGELVQGREVTADKVAASMVSGALGGLAGGVLARSVPGLARVMADEFGGGGVASASGRAAASGASEGAAGGMPRAQPPSLPGAAAEAAAEGPWTGAGARKLPCPDARGADDLVDLSSPARRRHILDGDATGGGHRAGTGIPGKSEFPGSWSDDQIMHHISDIATDPAATSTAGRGGRTILDGRRGGVDIRVVLEPDDSIVTGFPTNRPRNPR
jgi:RHS repeat-associated protein